MGNQPEMAIEPRLPSVRTLILVGFFSMLVIGAVDWLTEPHDLVTHNYKVIEAKLVMLCGRRFCSCGSTT
jgi:hypothetical protein